ncbi:sensor histidine kinase [Thalassotalea litorea]|uniref:sensor histidine kinase n=1 Tax=Thalassotalea litorea TaxID=2020715 RepID=UPI00373709AD
MKPINKPALTAKSGSINTAISKLLVSVVLIITLFYSTLLLIYSWVVEDNIFNRQVMDEAAYIQEVNKATGEIVQPRSSYMTLHLNWQGLPPQFKKEKQQKPDKVEFDYPDGRTIHLQLFTIENQTYVLSADVAGFEVSRDFLPRILWMLALLSLCCCLVVAVVAIFKARKITRPLNRLAEQVSKHQRIEDIQVQGHYPNNEIGTLAARIKDAFERLVQAWAREANFTKDVSHEIRTPVTIAKNLLAKPFSKVSQSDWQTLHDANLRLEQTTEILLALARNESTKLSNTNLTQLLEQCLLQNSDVNLSSKGQDIEFEIEAEQDVYQTINENLVSILFNNVLSNIVHYTSGKSVTIKITSHDITFTNAYHQTPPTELLKSGEKGQNSQGIGHGLSIVKRISDVCGWQVLVSATEKHFVLTLNFDK